MNMSPDLQNRGMNDAGLHAGSGAREECNALLRPAVPQRSNQIVPDCKTFFYIVQHGLLRRILCAAGAQ
ncbi:MAG: hypothetical protein AW07_02488 [Candidatus Accumulibacter sp. SK-11]|nr:MAG: hypothetical protein AW07_02488 [Candidatus Accumulibacter sp. SK-11]